ncbi:hypothetical protein BV25DRAFT_1814563 [Artomyces pyxidatus]|uniref:Uncharacterized protein n=1 Tax=Artomyces pyxidatus TaxID=48021 RepID=A0ACB8SKB2_9AGAM|nr:hypothetical protein BV25DRAFT_1814563 [Artomyces pyxidatus]
MKGLVGDAVGNMSISPSYRDVVLAARKGLFIIDLEAPLEVPRFLPQGGTWDVADVQWNPHPARAEYIVSTSSEKLLIWNLYLTGKTSIEHALHSHYRAITDINWHTQDPDVVVSTGIDSWLWAWDLRTPHKPVMGEYLISPNMVKAGGTQVKWNRQDGNVLASSHQNEVLIWDRRKGSLPVKSIKAHTAKIYGIDWAHNSSRELVTCSLDKTVKVWDVHDLDEPRSAFQHPVDSPELVPRSSTYAPRTVIRTAYPVWRARDLPFGRGILSLPQRGDDALEMWAHGSDQTEQKAPVEIFEGHNDVVKEFVWRRGGRDWNQFQLITWSKDKTLRFWPVEPEVMQKAGQTPNTPVPPRAQGYADSKFSFRNPVAEAEPKPALSAPVGQRGILAEVRAAPYSHARHPNPVLLRPRGSMHSQTPRLSQSQVSESEPDQTPTAVSMPITIAARKGGTMSRGNIAGKSARMDAFTWLASVKVGDRRGDGSSGTGSGANSGNASRIGSRSRPASREAGLSLDVRRSDSRPRWDEEGEPQSLQDEITSVLTKLSSSKIKLEKHDLAKKRTCTLGLNGPWGEFSSVFVRVTFTFPKDYPQATHPGGTPFIDLERTPLISIRNRAFMLRRLRGIRETRRPCLEACLRFLLFGNEDEHERQPVHIDFDSSSDEEGTSQIRKGRDAAVAMHNDKNIAEPVTSQGVFGPNGSQLVCFNRAPPRIVRNPMHELSVSPSGPSRSVESIPRLFQSPALISDAVRRLTVASHDQTFATSDPRRGENGGNILHIMTNLLMFSRLKSRRASEQSRALDEIPANYSLVPTHVITVFLRDASQVVGARAGQEMAGEHVFEGDDPAELCEKNAAVARKHGRRDHERFFQTMGMLFPSQHMRDITNDNGADGWGTDPLTHNYVTQIYNEFARGKDIQMLAILAVLLLKMYHPPPPPEKPAVRVVSPPSAILQRTSSGEQFSTLRRRKDSRPAPLSPGGWMRPASSPTTNLVSTSLSSMSSRGSWSSLFVSGSVRQLMTGGQDSMHLHASDQSNENLASPGIPVPGGGRMTRGSDIRLSGSDSPLRFPSPLKSWQETSGTSVKMPGAFPSTVTLSRSRTYSQVAVAKTITREKTLVVVDLRDDVRQERAKQLDIFTPEFLQQLMTHVTVYAEILFRWQLLHKRIELLKAVDHDLQSSLSPPHEIERNRLGISVLCSRCGNDTTPRGHTACSSCHARLTMPLCSICRLPVKGRPLIFVFCLLCHHVSHLSCWKSANALACAAGCGCLCKTSEGSVIGNRSAPGSYVMSPQSVSMPSLHLS